MTSHGDIRTALAKRFHRNGVLPDPETYDLVRPNVTARGETQYARVAAANEGDWDATLERLEYVSTRADLKRVLGFGHALTEFLVAPLGVEPTDDGYTDVLEAGATANLLVSTFDDLVDFGYDPDDVLSETGLDVAINGSPRERRRHVRQSDPLQRVTYRLVTGYFERVAGLPHADERDDVRETVRNYCLEMYAAERGTVTGADAEETNRVVAEYPFVVMGLPGWLLQSRVPDPDYERYRSWLHDVGDFLGLVDDAVDVCRDLDDDAYNRFTAERRDSAADAVLDDIADRGRRVLDEWAEMTERTSHAPTTRDALRVCVASWLGGRDTLGEQ